MLEAFRKYPDAKFVYSDCAEISGKPENQSLMKKIALVMALTEMNFGMAIYIKQ
jgi:hypothetical protein